MYSLRQNLKSVPLARKREGIRSSLNVITDSVDAREHIKGMRQRCVVVT